VKNNNIIVKVENDECRMEKCGFTDKDIDN